MEQTQMSVAAMLAAMGGYIQSVEEKVRTERGRKEAPRSWRALWGLLAILGGLSAPGMPMSW